MIRAPPGPPCFTFLNTTAVLQSSRKEKNDEMLVGVNYSHYGVQSNHQGTELLHENSPDDLECMKTWLEPAAPMGKGQTGDKWKWQSLKQKEKDGEK